MLRQRLITAGILVPLVMAGIWFLPTTLFALAIGLVGLIAAYELTDLAQLHKPIGKTIYLVLLASVALVSCQLLGCFIPFWAQTVIAIGWISLTLYLVFTRKAIQPSRKPCCWILASGGLVISMAWLSMVHIHHNHNNGPALILFLFFLTWAVDSSAFFAGKLWQQISASPLALSPAVSPQKTWVGVYGSMFSASLFGIVLWSTGWLQATLLNCILLCLLVAVASIGGDLWESLVKRRSGAKNSGDLLPGHGGMLDRVDSLLAAAPVFAFGLHSMAAIQ